LYIHRADWFVLGNYDVSQKWYEYEEKRKLDHPKVAEGSSVAAGEAGEAMVVEA
jgi:hypothetical protein